MCTSSPDISGQAWCLKNAGFVEEETRVVSCLGKQDTAAALSVTTARGRLDISTNTVLCSASNPNKESVEPFNYSFDASGCEGQELSCFLYTIFVRMVFGA